MAPGDLRFDAVSEKEADLLISRARAFQEEDGQG